MKDSQWFQLFQPLNILLTFTSITLLKNATHAFIAICKQALCPFSVTTHTRRMALLFTASVNGMRDHHQGHGCLPAFLSWNEGSPAAFR